MPQKKNLAPPTIDAVQDALRRAFLADRPLRKEDAQKSLELLPLLGELARAASVRMTQPFVLVDACAGKATVGVLAAALLLRERPGGCQVLALEREPARRQRALDAAAVLGVADRVSFVDADVADADAWPKHPDAVVALHACGGATDLVIDRAISAEARRILVVPCCYAAGRGRGHREEHAEAAAQELAGQWMKRFPLPHHGLVARRFAQAIIDSERTLRLEAAGFETEVVELFSPTVSPYNLLWRARRVREPTRMRDAQARLEALHQADG